MSISYSSRGVPVTRGKRCIVQREKFLPGGRISKAFTPYDSPWVRSWLWIFALRHWKKKRKRSRIEGKEEEERGGENDPRTEENCVGTTTMRFSFPTEWKNIHLFYSRLWRLTKRGLRKTRQLWSMRKRGREDERALLEFPSYLGCKDPVYLSWWMEGVVVHQCMRLLPILFDAFSESKSVRSPIGHVSSFAWRFQSVHILLSFVMVLATLIR